MYGMMRCWECTFRFHIFRYYTVNKQIFKFSDTVFSFKIFLGQSHMKIDRTGPYSIYDTGFMINLSFIFFFTPIDLTAPLE